MNNGARPGVLALFFLGGMAFMAALVYLGRPDLFTPEPIRLIHASSRPTFDHSQGASEPPSLAPADAPEPPQPSPLNSAPSNQRARTPIEIAPPLPAEPEPAVLAETNAPVIPSPAQTRPPRQRFSHRMEPTVALLDRVQTGNRIFGRAFLRGDPPPEVPITMDPQCGNFVKKPITTRLYVKGAEDALADVVIVVTEGVPHHLPAEVPPPAVIVQRKCQFEPYISAIRVGQRLDFENPDPILHNIHIQPMVLENREINFAQLPRSKPRSIVFAKAEDFIRMKCDVHPWMYAYVTVVDHPFFAVTGPDGRFRIDGLPRGRYTVKAMHRKAGTQLARIEVLDESSPDVTFEFVPQTDIAQRR